MQRSGVKKLNRDQSFFDRYSLVLGVLGAIALALAIVAAKIDDLTQGVYTRDAAEYQAAVAERIRPFGEVYMPGEEQESTAPTVTAAAEPDPVATVLSGPQVYNNACIACHATGVGGAPVVGETAAWTARIAQGTETLYDHAINGFTGSDGVMLAKGGRMDLSDAEIEDAVDYMVNESR
jgi:cytochrome c5